MKNEVGRGFKIAFFMLILICYGLTGALLPCFGQTSAMEELLILFQRKGTLTAQEADALRAVLAEERKELARVHRALEEKERFLEEKERALMASQGSGGSSLGSAGGGGTSPSEKATILEDRNRTERPLSAYYDDGFCLGSEDKEDLSLCFNSFLQADYRYFDYDEGDPQKNEFDLRRVRLALSGNLLKRFAYKFEYEFQGAGSRRLMDAYLESAILPFASFRIGQFKEPFGLEHVSDDEVVPFAERSMGYYLTPQRDLGAMLHGAFLKNRAYYAVGVFNGDGTDDSTGGNSDSPELTGRIGLSPFKEIGFRPLENLHFGVSASYAEVDASNVQVNVKTSGLTSFFDVASAAKFNIIRDADSRSRYVVEMGWAYGPLLIYGEYTKMDFEGIATSAERFDAGMEDYYGALLWMLTGEEPELAGGRILPVIPRKSLWEGGWGGLGLAVRYDLFEAEESVYDYLIREGNSVRRAEAYSVAVNWFLSRYVKFIVDFTRTEFDKPLLIARDPLSGTAIYSDREDVITARFQMGF